MINQFDNKADRGERSLMKKDNVLSRVFPALMVLVLLVMLFNQPLLAEETKESYTRNEIGRSEILVDEEGMQTSLGFSCEDAFNDATFIYLDGVYGDDDLCHGITKENAVKSFEKAKELATRNKNIDTIYIVGTVPIEGEISLEGTNAVLKRDADFNDYLLLVAAGSRATLTDITIDGNSEEAPNAERSPVICFGTLNIKESTVFQNNKSGLDNVLLGGDGVVYEGDAIADDSELSNPSGKISVNVTAQWEDHDDEAGIRPDKVKIRLLEDGVDAGKELVLSENNNWSGAFTNLHEYKDEAKIVYTIEEEEIEGYTYDITGDSGEGFVVMNCPVLGAETFFGNDDSKSIYWLSGAVLIVVVGGLLLLAFLRDAEAWLGG